MNATLAPIKAYCLERIKTLSGQVARFKRTNPVLNEEEIIEGEAVITELNSIIQLCDSLDNATQLIEKAVRSER